MMCFSEKQVIMEQRRLNAENLLQRQLHQQQLQQQQMRRGVRYDEGISFPLSTSELLAASGCLFTPFTVLVIP
jgi:hypothetical protein